MFGWFKHPMSYQTAQLLEARGMIAGVGNVGGGDEFALGQGT